MTVPGADPHPSDERAGAAAPDPAELTRLYGDADEVSSSDERDDRDAGGFGDDWYRDNRPPHHGG